MSLPPKLQALLTSRKFWSALVAVALVTLRAFVPNFPLSDDQISKVIFVLIAYIGGIALEDGLSARRR